MRRLARAISSMCLVGAFVATTSSAQTPYTIVDLGAGWAPTGINDSGTVIGNMFSPSGASNVVSWQTSCPLGCFSVLGNFGYGNATAAGINNSGLIAGTYLTATNAFHAYSFDGSNFVDLGTLGGPHSEATGLNNFGRIVGQSFLANGGYSAFVYSNGAMRDIGTPQGLSNSVGFAINDAGTVIGGSSPQFGGFTQSFTLTAAGDLSVIVPPTGYESLSASDINNVGIGVGFSRHSFQPPLGFTVENGLRSDIADPALFQPSSINDSGQIVGYASSGTQTGLYLQRGAQGVFASTLLPENTPWSLNTATGAFHINNAGQIVGVGVLNGEQRAFLLTPTTMNSVGMKPTDVELAKLSEAVYTKGAQELSGFATIQSEQGLGFGAVAFRRGDEIVVAFRGTDINSGSEPGLIGKIPAADILKDFAADGSFVSGSPTPALESYASQAAQFLAVVREANPSSNITLTGHSLGGALAQLVGNVSGFKTVAFNSPGPAGLRSDLADELFLVNNLSGGQAGPISTIRLWGDPFSAVGDQIGSLTTLGPLERQGNLVLSFSEALDNHSPAELIAALSDQSETRSAGLQGPFVNLANYVVPISETILNGATIYRFSQAVSPGIFFGIDPSGASEYTFLSDAGSPGLESIIFPKINGIDQFSLSVFSGTWSSNTLVEPLSIFEFGDGATGFTFFGLNQFGARTDLNGPILFDLKFSEGGTLNANLTAIPPMSPVPEPVTWMLMVIGFGLVGAQLRSRRKLEAFH